jgi:hypothetical protein
VPFRLNVQSQALTPRFLEQTFEIDTTPNAKQRQALELINAIRV